jgi:DNA-binding LytR/AlgR family response regulator
MIVEDEPLARSLLEDYIEKTPSLTLSHSTASPIAAIQLLQEDPPDILFLDVQMPELTGISLLKILKQKPFVVLTTAYSEYAIESYELDVIDYLLKPITYERFLKAIEKIKSLRHSDRSDQSDMSLAPQSSITNFFFVKDGQNQIKIHYDEIYYIEGLKDYVRIHTPNRKITTLLNLKRLEEILPDQLFMRVHNSYIIALNQIELINKDGVMIHGTLLPVSQTYKQRLKEFVDEKNLDG